MTQKILFVFTCLILSSSGLRSQNTFPSSGNVGIGTSSPGTNLELINSGSQVEIKLRHSSEYPGWGFSIKQASDLSASINAAGRDLQIQSGWDRTLFLGTTNYDTNGGKVVFPGGNVGIGVSSPLAKLQVNTSSSNTSYSNLTSPDLTLALSNSSNTNSNLNVVSFLDASNWGIAHIGVQVQSQANHTGRLFFSTRPSGSGPVQRMLIDENGKVGIGTLNPDQLLTVNGTIHSKEVKVDLSVPGPDYVFEKSYDLPSLDEVKSYIDENKHLPEVPSAKEMEKNGINVGEMNMLLLKKVEELTLYLVEQKKEIENLKSEISIIKDKQ